MTVERYSREWAALRDAGYVEVRVYRTGRVLMVKGAA